MGEWQDDLQTLLPCSSKSVLLCPMHNHTKGFASSDQTNKPKIGIRRCPKSVRSMQSTKPNIFPHQVPVLEALPLPKGLSPLHHQKKCQTSSEADERCRYEAILCSSITISAHFETKKGWGMTLTHVFEPRSNPVANGK